VRIECITEGRFSGSHFQSFTRAIVRMHPKSATSISRRKVLSLGAPRVAAATDGGRGFFCRGGRAGCIANGPMSAARPPLQSLLRCRTAVRSATDR
jgi:hypothetical protein